MALRYGLKTLFDTDREFINTVGQSVVYEHVVEVINRWNMELAAATALFIQGRTEEFKLRYKLPGGGHLQRTRQQSGAAVVKAAGEWDVAFPLEEFGVGLGSNEVDMAYMTAGDLSTHLSTVFAQAANTYRFEMLKRLLNNVQTSFADEYKGTLLIEPLANGDAVVYPPVLGVENEATDDHYLETGYIVSAISATNNPLKTGRDELEEHFGTSSGGENIVAICAKDVSDEIQATLTGADFTVVPDRFIQQGDDKDIPSGLPSVPGKIVGRGSGCWVAEWRWLPSNYIIFQHLEEDPPLMERVDPSDTGLVAGLQLVATDEIFPLTKSSYRWRFGLGTTNRLNGVVIEVASGGTYTIPTAYV